jgi:hypothetical protein
MRPTCHGLGSCVAATLVLLGSAGAAGAAIEPNTPFYEGVVGASQPVGFSDYQDFANLSLKAGFRAGQYLDLHVLDSQLAWEMALDWTRLDSSVEETGAVLDAGFTRLRALVGVRLARPLGATGTMFGRLGLGAEQVFGSTDEEFLGSPRGREFDSFGVVAEPGVGVVWPVGNLALGVQLALPIAVHFADDGYIQYDPVSFDIDALFTLSSKL